jgi:hypothetical protein
MASTSGNARLVLVAAIAAFIAGCWTGMGTDDGSQAYCVVTVASAPERAGFTPGQLVEREGSDCASGEPQVCGSYDGSGDDRKFVSDECKDD